MSSLKFRHYRAAGSLSTELAAARRDFGQSVAEIESGFVELGHWLEETVRSATSLAGDSGHWLADLEATLTGGCLGGFAEQISAVEALLRRDESDARESAEILHSVPSRLQHVQAYCRTIRGSALFLRSCGILFAIESARCANDRHFTAFGKQTVDVSENMERLAQDIDTDAAAAQSAMSAAAERTAGHLAARARLTREAGATGRAAVDEAQRFLDECHSSLAETQEVARGIGTRAAEGVYYLQFGDLIRQQCEQVLAALADAENAAGAFGAAAVVARILRLQLAHLAAVEEEVNVSTDKLRQVVSGLHAALAAFATNAATDPLAGLARLLGTLRDEATEGRRLIDDIARAGNQAVAAAEGLSRHSAAIQTISNDLFLRAINANVMTSQVGAEGLGLQPLAQEVTVLQRRVTEVADGMMRELTTVLTKTRQLARGEGESVSRSAEDAIVGANCELQRVHDDLAATGAALAARAQEQMRHAARYDAQFEFLRDLRTRIADHRAVLARIVTSLPDDARINLDHVNDELERRYTMERQRQVHAGYRTDAAEMVTVAEASDDLGDNVELF